MLQIQRASAGSGKTYLLAKKFIEYFISYKTNSGERRLRPHNMLRDSLPHILAITFTNKATNEMKLRIVEKLDALAHWTPDIPIRKVDYMSDFIEEFQAAPEQIASTCSDAIRIMLNDYGDFKVSTIDSFFQTVLRTFAFEADLDDTYQLELDSDYVAQIGLDTALDEIEADHHDASRSVESSNRQGTAWILNFINEKSDGGSGWNIFQKKNKNGNIYKKILDAAYCLKKEDFKLIREDLDDYFAKNPDFLGTYDRLKEVYESPLLKRYNAMKEAADALIKAFRMSDLDIDTHAGQYLASRAHNFASNWKWDERGTRPIVPPVFDRKGSRTRVFNPKLKSENPHLGTETEDHLESLAIEMYDRYLDWHSYLTSPAMTKWFIYRDTLPLLGILQTVRDNSREFLNGVNTVELAETNSIISRIIGDEDAPFVYERLGSRLEHFLIDEFQDTSRMQWKNLRPLVAESEGQGNDNLIIGDAKQSIYRFRNADPSLITEKVPQEFRKTVCECGNTPKENTNWRSMRRIVEFNNLFFRYFSRALSPDMETLYSNTVQPPHHTEDAGYVEVHLFKNQSGEKTPAHFADIPRMIEDMLDRGYRQADIAVLVDRHDDGSGIIDAIMAHNRSAEARHIIDFISEDSLRVGDASAVVTIISVLEAIEKGTRAELRSNEERHRRGVGDWSKLQADFSFFAMSHRDLSLSEQMTRFLAGEYNPDVISEMLARMQTTALPALIENISEYFLPENVRNAQAPFLATLQDLVLDFCDSRSADIASFLEWWEMKGKKCSISSPEDADAVKIMTVHKSKGLEFRCVIVPNSKQRVKPDKDIPEWLWVEPDLSEAGDISPIPWIPVWSNSALEDTVHAPAKESFLKKYVTDKVNMAYVAYTRAVDELYIFAPYSEGKEEIEKEYFSGFLWECATQAAQITDTLRTEYPGIEAYIPSHEDIRVFPDEMSWSLGHRPDRDEVERTTESRRKPDTGIITRPIERYPSSSALPYLQYKDPASPDDNTPDETESHYRDPEENEEQRRRGEILHRIMEYVATPEDLPKALLRMKSRGYIGFREMPLLEKRLSEAIGSVASYGWFAPGLTLLNERGFMIDGRCRRPDRVILHGDGSATIIDYKFGEHRADADYSKQLKSYAYALRAVGLAQKIEAYIWYVSLGVVVKVGSCEL